MTRETERQLAANPAGDVPGYKPQTAEARAAVTQAKWMEERVLRLLDDLATMPGIDPRWLQAGRTDIEKGFMSVNRAVFKPGRVALPGDEG